jgi:hypothetical protein
MAKIQRRRDIIEIIAERTVAFIIGGVVLVITGFILKGITNAGVLGDSSWISGFLAIFGPIGWFLIIAGVVCCLAGIYTLFTTSKVKSFNVTCPFCEVLNTLTEKPEEDFDCVGCNRMVPIQDGKVMEVQQVRCGFCQALNWYCEKTEVLICESCDHEIPIFQEDGRPTKTLPKGYALTEDDAVYELVLTEAGTKTEEVITTLQAMLALNRNQVKDILDQLPSTLLTGINRRKAEMLQAQLAVHGASATIQALAL